MNAQPTINQIVAGDCVENLKRLPPGCVDLVFADPPFNIGYDYDVYDDARGADEYLEFCEAWIAGVHRALRSDGTFWLAIGDEYAAELKVLSRRLGFHCRSWVIWYYTFGVNCARGFSRSHTHLFHLVKDRDRFTFNGDNPAVRVPSARQLVYADKRANSKGRLPDNTWILRPQDAPPGGFDASHDTWFFSRVAGTFKEREGFHGCQMPEQLLGRIVRTSSNPGDLVLDPFGGSGTTLVTAKKLGRRYLGFELSGPYVEHIRSRLDATAVGDPLDGVDDPLKSAKKTSAGRRRTAFRGGRPVVPLHAETEDQLIAIFRRTATGRSADSLLCDPDLSRRFAEACRWDDVVGDEHMWRSFLLRIRKTGKLPAATRVNPRMTTTEMDPYLAAAEVAMRLIRIDYGMTVDELLCAPMALAEFDAMAAEFAPGFEPSRYRWAALSIRKRARTKRLREHTAELARQFEAQSIPETLPLASVLDDPDVLSHREAVPGVYAIAHASETIYVGETEDIRRRLIEIDETTAWQRFAPESVRIWTVGSDADRFALRSFLVTRQRPLLNSEFLIQDALARSDQATASPQPASGG